MITNVHWICAKHKIRRRQFYLFFAFLSFFVSQSQKKAQNEWLVFNFIGVAIMFFFCFALRIYYFNHRRNIFFSLFYSTHVLFDFRDIFFYVCLFCDSLGTRKEISVCRSTLSTGHNTVKLCQMVDFIWIYFFLTARFVFVSFCHNFKLESKRMINCVTHFFVFFFGWSIQNTYLFSEHHIYYTWNMYRKINCTVWPQ